VTTQPDIGECLAALGEDTRHFEVETYAWSVLPRALQTADLADGIAQELRWLRAADARVTGHEQAHRLARVVGAGAGVEPAHGVDEYPRGSGARRCDGGASSGVKAQLR
jgi:hypothetical protein